MVLGIFVLAVWSTHYISPFSIAAVDGNLRLPVRTSPELKSTSNLSGIGGDHILWTAPAWCSWRFLSPEFLGEQSECTRGRVPVQPERQELETGPVALRWRLDRWPSCAYYPQESRKNESPRGSGGFYCKAAANAASRASCTGFTRPAARTTARAMGRATMDNGAAKSQQTLALAEARLGDLKAMLDDMRVQRDDMREQRDA